MGADIPGQQVSGQRHGRSAGTTSRHPTSTHGQGLFSKDGSDWNVDFKFPGDFFPIQVKVFPHVPWPTYNTGNSILPESIFPVPAWLGSLSPNLLAAGSVQPVRAFIPKYDCIFMVPKGIPAITACTTFADRKSGEVGYGLVQQRCDVLRCRHLTAS